MAQLADRPLQTFTIGFEESDYSELQDARTVAQYLGTDHYEMVVKPATVEILPDLVWHLDEPLGDSSALPTYYVCHAARQQVTVAVSGDGGDEVFAGYNLYQQVDYYQRMSHVPAWIRRKFIKLFVHLLPFTWPGWNYLYALSRWRDEGLPCELGIYPWIQEQLYTPAFKLLLQGSDPFQPATQLLRQGMHLDPISRYQYFDTLQYLPADILTKVDRMSMANSLEVRSPLLDYTVVEYMATLPPSLKLRGAISKYLLRKLCGKILPPSVLT
jgi:asparagine synthase (glutamine-hydrolysing)